MSAGVATAAVGTPSTDAAGSDLPRPVWVPEGWEWTPYTYDGEQWAQARDPEGRSWDGIPECAAYQRAGADRVTVQVRLAHVGEVQLTFPRDTATAADVLAAAARGAAFLRGAGGEPVDALLRAELTEHRALLARLREVLDTGRPSRRKPRRPTPDHPGAPDAS